MVNCAAFGCTNRSTSRPDLSFHKIPSVKNKVLRQKWLHNIRRTGNLPKDSSFSICSEHFEEDYIKRDFQVAMLQQIFILLISLFLTVVKDTPGWKHFARL